MDATHNDDGRLPSKSFKPSFRFLELPGEQRNEIYRCLFDDITKISGAFDVWKSDLPGYSGKLASYAALARTCRSIHQEARTIFHAEYLSSMTLFFDDLRTFASVCGPNVKGGLKASGARFVFRMPILPETAGFGVMVMQLMVGPGFRAELIPVNLHDSLVSMIHGSAHTLWDYQTAAVGGSSVRVHLVKDAVYYVTKFPRILPKFPQLTMLIRSSIGQSEAAQATETIEGRFRDLTWRGWEAGDDMKVGILCDMMAIEIDSALHHSRFE